MTFQMPVAFGIVAATVALLSFFSVLNRRSGWKRERRDLVTEMLMAWAEARAEERRMAPSIVKPAEAPIAVQLSNLNAVLQMNAGVQPAAQTSSKSEQDVQAGIPVERG
jgi:hypothetical protein